jgi:choline dehydrogenase-like flavoprotein
MAEQLVNAGYNVLVLEKGGYYQANEFAQWRESEAMAKLYDRGGLAVNSDGSIIVLSGSCVGGGSTVNWCASFRTPEHVMKEWNDSGIPGFEKNGEFEKSLDYVENRMNVNCDYSHYDNDTGCHTGNSFFKVNENNRLLWKVSVSFSFSFLLFRYFDPISLVWFLCLASFYLLVGCQAATNCGCQPEKIPRNVKSCVDCGSCCFGCSHKSKQSTISTLLEPILLSQYKEKEQPLPSDTTKKGQLYIIPDCKVNRIKYSIDKETGKKIATGVDATVSIYPKYLEQTLQRTLIATM